ncbi:hypothetical protein [Pseudomonas urmiensis]|uniref:hypothetical protein n=1 Tax=Pseudomonas urmiensis TaxID=2745493 RepID=UPI003D0F6CE5
MSQDFFTSRRKFAKIDFEGLRVGILVSALLEYFKLNNMAAIQYFRSSIKKMLATPIVQYPEQCISVEGYPIFISILRQDYIEIARNVESQLSRVNECKVIEVSLINKASTLRELFKCFSKALKLTKGLDYKWYEVIYIFSSFYYVLKGVHRLEQYCSVIPKNAIFFNSSSFPESLLCEYMRSRGAKTFSLQHGMYLKPNIINYDIVNISNVMADVMLCWGEFSKQEIEKFYLENNLEKKFVCKVAGYPRISSYASQAMDCERAIFVVLPRILYKAEILKLFDILNKSELTSKIVVKPHPSVVNDIDVLDACQAIGAEILSGSLTEWLGVDRYAAVIGFNTTSLFECIESSEKVLLFRSGNDEFISDLFESFSCENSLNELVNSSGVLKPSYNFFFADLQSGYIDCLRS